MNIVSSSEQIFLAEKSDKKNIKRFYKQQHYSARFIGLDSCFYITNKQNVGAAVIVSQVARDNPQYLLHGLVVDKSFQQQGLALRLLAHASKKFTNLICFADSELSSLYLKANFNSMNALSLSPELLVRYQQYIKKNNNLVIFAINRVCSQ